MPVIVTALTLVLATSSEPAYILRANITGRFVPLFACSEMTQP